MVKHRFLPIVLLRPHVLSRKYSLPVPRRTLESPTSPPLHETTPDHAWNSVVQWEGPADWPLKIFRRFSLRPESDPVYLSVEKALSHYFRVKDMWLRSAERDQMVALLQQYKPADEGWQIKDACLVGVGRLCNAEGLWSGGPEARDRFLEQLTQFLDVVEHLKSESQRRIQCYVQEVHVWSDVELEMLKFLDIDILNVPQAEQRAGKGSFIFLPWTALDTQWDFLACCPPLRPTLVLNNDRRQQSRSRTSSERKETYIEVRTMDDLVFQFDKPASAEGDALKVGEVCEACKDQYYNNAGKGMAAAIAAGDFDDAERNAYYEAIWDPMNRPYQDLDMRRKSAESDVSDQSSVG